MADSLLDLGSAPLWFPDGIVDWKQEPDLDFDLSRNIVEFSGTGQQIVLHSEETPQSWSFRVTNRSKREEFELLEAFVRTFQARKRRFWFPVPFSLFALSEYVPQGSTTVSVAENRMEYRGHERFFMSLRGGDRISRRITGLERVSGSGAMRLSVAAMPEVGTSDVDLFSLLALCRFDQDSMKISHMNALFSETTVKIAEVMEYGLV